MTNKELRKLSKSDLLEMLINSEKNNQMLNKENQELRTKLEEREIRISEAGSIAEAAFALNGVFEAAQQAVSQYQDNIRRLNNEQESMFEHLIEKALKKAKEECASMDKKTEEMCEAVIEETRKQVKKEWKRIHFQAEAFHG